jgi:peptidoglycan/LPS O-acetylase OafA/YrhL
MIDSIAPSRQQDVKSAPSDRLALLDCLRGVAVLAVIALHSGGHGLRSNDHFFSYAIWPVLRHGYLGVQLFFVISGYCIMAAAVSVQSDKTPLRTFISRRVRRIFPPFWCSLLFVIGLGLLTVIVAKKTWWSIFPLTELDWLWNILLLHGAIGAPDASMVYWSLSIEVQFYGLMAIAVVAGRWKAVWLLGLSGLYLWWAWQPWFPIGGTPLAYWPEFASGIAAYLAVNWRVWGRSLPAVLWGLSAAAIVVGWQTSPVVFAGDGEFTTPYKQLFCLLCGLGIWGGHCFKGSECQLVWLRPLAWIGTISYSLYLTHEPVATRVFNLAGRLFDLGGLRWVPVAVLASVAQLLVGWLFFRYCERPWLNRSSRSAKRSVDLADLTHPAATEVLVG